MKLSGSQLSQLQAALLDAFRSQSDLARMVRFGLDAQLNEISSEKSKLPDIVFDLINWAETNNRIDDLLQAATKANSGNRLLRDFAVMYESARLAAPKPTTKPETPSIPYGQARRIADLKRNIDADYELLRAFESELQVTDNPRQRLKYEREIARQKEALAGFETELAALTADAPPSAQSIDPDLAQLTNTLQQMAEQVKDMEERLAAGQAGLSEQMRNQYAALLDHIDAQHRASVETVLAQLDSNQIETIDLLYDMIDQQKLLQMEADDIRTLVQRTLAETKTLPNASYWAELLDAVDSEQSWQSKFKLTLPIVPLLLDYEMEFSTELLPNAKYLLGQVREAWDRLRASG